MSLMLDEICEQPEIIRRLTADAFDPVKALAAEVARRDIRLVVIAGRGSSDHAAIYGKYLLEIRNSIPVALADCSIFTLYDAHLDFSNALVVGISQSGAAPDVSEYVEKSREYGALTAAITNVADSRLYNAAEYPLLCGAGPEKSVAATKTYTSTLGLLYMLSKMMGGRYDIDDLLGCADSIQGIIDSQDKISSETDGFTDIGRGAVLGRGYNLSTALETALKLAETNGIGVTGYSAADFMHGPIASIHPGDPVILIAPHGGAFEVMTNTCRMINERGMRSIVVSSREEVLSIAANPIEIESQMSEELSPVVYIAAGQLFSYYLATKRGCDPDNPTGLTKVTKTR